AAARQAREARLQRRRARAARAGGVIHTRRAAHHRGRPGAPGERAPPPAADPRVGLAGPATHPSRGRAAAGAARERLAFEELFLYQAALDTRRARRASGGRGIALPARGERVAAWLGSLPFELTADQRRAVEEIDAD